MKNYLVGILYCGDCSSRKTVVKAEDEKTLWEKIYLSLCGYGDLEDSIEDLKKCYKEDGGEEFEKDIEEIKDEITNGEDILEFVFDCESLKMIWDYDECILQY